MAENYSTGTTPQITNPTRVIEVKILQALNNGGGGSGAADFINYGGPPVTNPPALQNIVVDTNGRQWQYFQGGWH